MVGMSRFQDYCDLFVEAHGIRKLPAVADLVVGHVLFVNDSSAEGIRGLLHASALREIIVSTSAVHARRPSVFVDEDHVVAFAPPRALEVRDAVVAANVLASALRLPNNVVNLPSKFGIWVSRPTV